LVAQAAPASVGQPTDEELNMRRGSPILLVGALVAALALLAGTAVLWSRDHAAPAAGVPAPPATRPPPDPATLQLLVDGVVKAGAPGAVALVRGGQGTWQGASGLGDLGARRPARASDRFRIGSVTKSFVATVVLQLVGESRLRLDDTVQQWLPGAVPDGEHITIRQLLNHTSGLYNYTDDLLRPLVAKPTRQAYQQLAARSFTPQALVAMATGHRPLFPPGTRFSYSNTNYILLGLLVEQVTGDRLAGQLQQRILAPLGLDDTELPGTQRRIRGQYLHGYAPSDRAWLPSDGSAGLVDVTQADPSWAWAAGAMISSAADLARFYQALLGGRLLGPDLLKAMQTTVDASEQYGPGAGYGLGLMRLALGCGGQVWGHGGEVPGYATMAFGTQDATRQLVLTDNLLPAPGGAVQSAVENDLNQGLSC
jgi:D-alanyl-D-alanine carboxypeptidase